MPSLVALNFKLLMLIPTYANRASIFPPTPDVSTGINSHRVLNNSANSSDRHKGV